jgi:hypothetical protein
MSNESDEDLVYSDSECTNKKIEKSQKNFSQNKDRQLINDDNAMEIINVEFSELKDWLKGRVKYLHRECIDVIDCIKLKKEIKEEDY